MKHAITFQSEFIPTSSAKIAAQLRWVLCFTTIEMLKMSPIKVLVIDDNRVHAEGLAELLELSGFESSAVWTGWDGIEMAERLAVDAVLLDVNLPDIEGFEVCRRLRENPATAEIAIIFHTGSSPHPGLGHEADSFLTYPIAISEIASVIKGSVLKRRSRKEG